MPRIPTYDNFDVMPSTGPSERVADNISAEKLSTGAREMQDLGKAETEFGNAETTINVDQARLANELRVEDAVNQVRQHAQDLTYNPDNGYANLKGAQALQRPNGMALDEEYGQKLQNKIGEIGSNLSNPVQQRLFAMRSNDLLTSFKGNVEQHMLGQFQDYHVSVAKGSQELSQQDAETNWNDPAKLDNAINGTEDPATGQRYGGIKQSIWSQGVATGKSANEIEAAQKAATSSVYAKAIESALQNNNPTYAMGLFDKVKGQLTGDDILQVQGKINTHMDGQLALKAVTDSTKKYASNFAPSDMDRLTGLMAQKESTGGFTAPARDYDAKGNVLTSPAGARYSMQVEPQTAINPGFGIKPAQSDTPEEYNRVGRELIGKLLQKYGDVGKALAAYNWGTGNVDAAVEKYGADWTQHAPAETQDYVTKISKQFGAGVGAPPLPTKADFVNDALDRLGDSPRPETVAATRETAEKQYQLLVDSRKEQGEQALARAQQELIANGGDFTGLQPQTVADLSRFDPDKYDNAVQFARSIRKDSDPMNMAAYAAAVTYPKELGQMSDTQFMQFLVTNHVPAREQERLSTLRANVLNGKSPDTAETINDKALNLALSSRLTNIGIDPAPKKGDLKNLARVGNIQKFIRDDLYDQQAQLGRKMTPEEIESRMDELFSKSIDLPGVLWGTNSEPLMSMKPGDIPASVREQIKAKFAQHGITNPTDNDILRAYWKNKNAR